MKWQCNLCFNLQGNQSFWRELSWEMAQKFCSLCVVCLWTRKTFWMNNLLSLYYIIKPMEWNFADLDLRGKCVKQFTCCRWHNHNLFAGRTGVTLQAKKYNIEICGCQKMLNLDFCSRKMYKNDLLLMCSTVFWCLIIVQWIFRLNCITNVTPFLRWSQGCS